MRCSCIIQLSLLERSNFTSRTQNTGKKKLEAPQQACKAYWMRSTQPNSLIYIMEVYSRCLVSASIGCCCALL